MISFDFRTLAERTRGRILNRKFEEDLFSGISIDTRTIKPKQLFVAISGDRNDGHKFLGDAVEKECAGLLIRSDFAPAWEHQGKLPIVIVEDTHTAMIDLAKKQRGRYQGKLIGITGSNGKTTTKEMTHAIISYKVEKVYKSPGNYNNLFGLPLAVFELPEESDYAVLELGISVKGEMTRLAEIAVPDLILITNVGPTHLETLGSIEGVAEAKMELVDAASADIPVLINADDAELVKAAARRNREFVTFGFENEADYQGKLTGVNRSGSTDVIIDGRRISLNLFGIHQAYNFLAAYAAARTIGVDVSAEDLNRIDYSSDQYRGEIERFEDLTVISDCYNANPGSMRSGLESFKRFLELNDNDESRGVVIVGDMLELGKKSGEYHVELGNLLAEMEFGLIIAVGPEAEKTFLAAVKAGVEPEKISYYGDVASAGRDLIEKVRHGDIIYLKASRGIGLEKLITLLRGTALRQN